MDRTVYLEMARTEVDHWWFRGRRAVVASMIQSMPLPEHPAILDAGCGTGGNLGLLSQFGAVHGMEYDETARSICHERYTLPIEPGFLPDMIPFPEKRFDLITLFDVLEHVEHDGETLKALAERLHEDGWLLLTVPAFQSLMSQHDVIHHHRRRYSLRQVTDLVRQAGLEIERSGYFNFFLFPPAFLGRKLEKLVGSPPTVKLGIPWRPVNAVLAMIFSFESHLWSKVRFPFGLSVYVKARKREQIGNPLA